MTVHAKGAERIRDDIEIEPHLVLIPQRTSGTPETDQGMIDTTAHLRAISIDTFRYWNRCNGRRTTDAILVEGSDLPDFTDGKWYCCPYPMIRSSNAKLFQTNDGSPSKEDEEVYALLQNMNAHAAATGSWLVVIVAVRALDGWFTEKCSWEYLSDEFPDLDIRLSFVVSSPRVDQLPHLFTPRHHAESPSSWAWACVDLHLIALIAAAVCEDPDEAAQWEHLEQWSIVPIFEQASCWKTEYGTRGTGAHHFGESWPIACKLLYLEHRTPLIFPDLNKDCSQCQGQSSTFWSRCPINASDVICEPCLADFEPDDAMANTPPINPMQSGTLLAPPPPLSRPLTDGPPIERS